MIYLVTVIDVIKTQNYRVFLRGEEGRGLGGGGGEGGWERGKMKGVRGGGRWLGVGGRGGGRGKRVRGRGEGERGRSSSKTKKKGNILMRRYFIQIKGNAFLHTFHNGNEMSRIRRILSW